MVLEKYIRRLFAEKVLLTIAISLTISIFIEIAGGVSKCKEVCSVYEIFKSSVTDGVVFVNDAIFFIISIASIWFIFRIISSNQMQIITVYTGSFLFTLKNVAIVITYICFIYLFPFNHFILHNIKKNHITSQTLAEVEKMWIKNINTSNNTSNGSFYLLQNVSKYKTGLISKSINVYTVSDGYLTHYINYKNVFITKSQNGDAIFFNLDIQNKTTKQNINSISFDDVQKNFQDITTNEFGSFYTDIKKLILNTLNPSKFQNTYSVTTLLHNIQICISLFASTLIPFTQLLSIKTVRGSGINGKVIQTVAFIIISYTMFEIVKIIDIGATTNHITSIAITAAIALAFLSRFVKIYH